MTTLGCRHLAWFGAPHAKIVRCGLSVIALASLSPSGLAKQPASQLSFEKADTPGRFGWVDQTPGLPERFERDKLLGHAGIDADAVHWLGALSLGDANSRSIAVAVTGSDANQLWVDLDRDRQFSPEEKFSASDVPSSDTRNWRVPLNAEYALKGVGETAGLKHLPLSVFLQFESASRRLRIQTAGVMAGKAIYLGTEVVARYEDRNANGRWFDIEDRIFVDLNQDGRLDSLVERLPARGTKRIQGALIAINGDPLGRSLSLVPITDNGSVTPSIELAEPDAVVERFDATIASASGFRIRLVSPDETVEVPIGEYRVQSASLTLRSASGQRFAFEFVSDRAVPTFTVTAGSHVTQPLLGHLLLTGRMSLDQSNQQLVITSSLRTETNLYLANCSKGRASLNENRLQTSSSYLGDPLGIGSSGFS